MSLGEGTLGIAIWPAYVGACIEDPGPGPIAYGEPESTHYARGQINWGIEASSSSEQIVGRALIHAPAGIYTHLAYFRGPEGPCMSGKLQLQHPIVFPSSGVIEIYPITNDGLKLLKAQGCS